MNQRSYKPSRGDILVVDDTLVNLRILTEMLAAQGYKVRPVTSGAQALQAAATIAPDLVLLDINMQGMTGYEVCLQLKAQLETRDVPVIFMSARDEVLDKIRAFEVGGVDYVTKPFHLEELLARVATHVSLRALQRQLEDSRLLAESAAAALADEKTRSDDLLYSLLPPSVARPLREGHPVVAERYPQVSVLSCRIVDFTALAAEQPPRALFDLLGHLHVRFDALLACHPVYKFESMGDHYLIASGVPDANPRHAEAIIDVAFDMLDSVSGVTLPTGAPLQLRLGVHTGPVVAGIVGTLIPRFCIHGDTVHLASSLEASSPPMHLHVSGSTLAQLDPSRHTVEERSEITLTGMGAMTTYFVRRTPPN